MGVANLLPLLGPITKRIPLSTFKGKRIAIDGYVWLHRAAFSCASDLVKDPGTPKILPYLSSRMRRLLVSGIIPVVVFDGQMLPQKGRECAKRRQERGQNRERAIALEERGMSHEAFQYYQRAVEITSATVFQWIGQLKEEGIEYIVAPYEADAQLAYLARTGYVHAVLTEDSDLLPYQTPITLFKLDDGNNVACVKFKDVLEHLQLTVDQFIAVCCFAGCDYIEHINKVGIQTALKTIKTVENGEHMINLLRESGKYQVPDDYEEQLERAMLTFKSQRIYDPCARVLRTLTPVDGARDLDFLGPDLAPDLLAGLVSGDVDTRTLKRLHPEAPIGKKSPYFSAKVSPVSSPRTPERKSRSPYFSGYRSGVKKDTRSMITSYFSVSSSQP